MQWPFSYDNGVVYVVWDEEEHVISVQVFPNDAPMHQIDLPDVKAGELGKRLIVADAYRIVHEDD